MPDAYLTSDGLRAACVLALAVAQAVMAQWPEWRHWPDTVPKRSARQSVPIVPIDWAFAIWGLIYLGCAAFAVWQILPDQLDDPQLRGVGWLAAAAFALNTMWEYYVPKRDIDWGSVAIIVTALAVLLAIVARLEAAEPHDAPTVWLVAALVLLLAAAALGTGVALATGAAVYAAAVAWALFGIVVANRIRDHDAVVGGTAGLLIPVVLAAAWIGA